MSALRFVLQWNRRQLRRHWRQSLLLVGLVGSAVAVSVAAILAAYNLAEPPVAENGLGRIRVVSAGTGDEIKASLVGQRLDFAHVLTTSISTPGAGDFFDLRAQDPSDAIGAPLLDLRRGRFATPASPSGSGDRPKVEATVTSDIAAEHRLQLGDTLLVDANARPVALQIVGIVENPTDLDDSFALVPDLSPLGIPTDQISSAFLVDAAASDLRFDGDVGNFGVEETGGFPVDARTFLALVVNVVGTVALVEAGLLVGAAFAVLARRRTRQFGLLAAIGATPRLLRSAAATNGLAIGAMGALGGTALGVAAAAAIVPRLEDSVGHRISFSVPWWTIAPTLVLASAVAAAAAWWPSRSLTSAPITTMLASQRPRTTPAPRRRTAAALFAVGAGVGALGYGVSSVNPIITLGGVVLALLGAVASIPQVVRWIGAAAKLLPLTGRIAARTLARRRSRTTPVIASLVIALGIPAGIAVASTAIDDQRNRAERNLGPGDAIAWLPGAEAAVQELPADLDAEAAAPDLERIADILPNAKMAPLQVAVDSRDDHFPFSFEGLGTRPSTIPVFAIRPARDCLECDLYSFDEGGQEYTAHDAWIATTELLDVLEVRNGANNIDAPPTRALAIARWENALLSTHRDNSNGPVTVVNDDLPAKSSLAGVLIEPAALDANGWEPMTVGWLITNEEAIDADHRDDIRRAVGESLRTEFRREPRSTRSVRRVGLAVGVLVALGILLPVIGLVAVESAGEQRLLAAIGADPGTTRRIAAASAGLHALAAAALAIPLGYLALLVMRGFPGSDHRFVVAWVPSAVLLFGVPLVAAAIGYVASPRRPDARGRPA